MILWWKKEIESLGHGIYSMDPRAKHEKEHEDLKKEREAFIVSRITRLLAWYELTKNNQEKELKVVMKNNVHKNYEWKHCKI